MPDGVTDWKKSIAWTHSKEEHQQCILFYCVHCLGVKHKIKTFETMKTQNISNTWTPNINGIKTLSYIWKDFTMHFHLFELYETVGRAFSKEI